MPTCLCPTPPSSKTRSAVRTELHAHELIQQIPSIQNLLLHLEGKGRSKNTLIAYEKNLKALAMRADLKDTKAVELAIARYIKKDDRPATNNYKSKLCDCYHTYCKLNQIYWEKPTYTPEPTTVQPPTTEKVLMLISSARLELSIKIDISAQTGLRPIEIQGEKGLQASNIHPDQNTITARITKGCNPRPPLKVTPELMARLQAYIAKHKLQPNDLLFKGKTRNYGKYFRDFKNRLAEKLNDQTIKTIRLYDLRHYYCTKQLLRMRNCEEVRIIMGHKKLNTTQKYLHLLGLSDGEWIVEGTTDDNKAKELLKNDFQYQLTTPDGTMLFRKRK